MSTQNFIIPSPLAKKIRVHTALSSALFFSTIYQRKSGAAVTQVKFFLGNSIIFLREKISVANTSQETSIRGARVSTRCVKIRNYSNALERVSRTDSASRGTRQIRNRVSTGNVLATDRWERERGKEGEETLFNCGDASSPHSRSSSSSGSRVAVG